MPKKRIYELAKELNIPSIQLVSVLKDLGVEVKTHSSTIDEETAILVHEIIAEQSKTPASAPEEVTPAQPAEAAVIEPPKTPQEFATRFSLDPTKMMQHLWKKGEMITITQSLTDAQRKLLEALIPPTHEVIATLPASHQTQAPQVIGKVKGSDGSPSVEKVARAPVVTVLGHVDHGKTTLLDAIRHSAVAEGEKGGITQKIGASEVTYRGQRLVLIDTPGHEAFTAMRAQGAKVTDIAILVVAADEGVMPQSIEALNHAKAAKVAVIVAVNKMDKEGANLDRVKQQLADLGLIPEEWGGDTIFVPISAKKEEGIDKLLEMITLLAELMELRTPLYAPASGTVIEARLDKGLGAVADVIVQEGTLHVGDFVQIGDVYSKVRSIINPAGIRVKQSGTSSAVELVGLEEVPKPGETFRVVKELKGQKVQAVGPSQAKEFRSTDKLFKTPQKEANKFPVILKADSQGTLDALQVAIKKIKSTEIEIEIVHIAVGAITESDLLLASVTGSMVLGFNVRPDSMAKKASERVGIEIRTYDLIYELVTDLESCIRGKCEPRIVEKPLGRALVRKIYRVPKTGLIAGSYVQEGKVERNSKVRIVRANIVIGESKVSSLRRFKEDVREVASGYECGIGLDRSSDLQEEDILEFYTLQAV